MTDTRRVTNLALLVSVGLVLSIIESALPPLLPLPGARIGLANIAGVIALYLFGASMALEVTVLRALIGGLLRGSVVGLFLSFSGGLASILVMIALFALFEKAFSIIGVSVAGAVTHNVIQLFAAYLLVRNTALFYYMPYLILIAAPTGLFVGFAARRVTFSLENLPLHSR
ncbi:MAG: heptaprenyl diphosphate synthase [Candidatus Anoxymicrobium japonicum]|uniref:Heptaprenyl diphosphate synthase n=1 Tax=Candidatus Anoxymicrobium japonicum TaxID=2013648 RepID=A0A2N3G731_9ACTN|nr:MAG: heptaprenyl diphosphate synthase [Candidatus Anoxymicrobium japonicum]